MPGPIDSLLFGHTALERESASLAEAFAQAAEPSPELRARLAFLLEVGDAHTRGEELGLFPALDERFPHFAQTYLFDHVDEHTIAARLHGALDRWAAGEAAGREEARREMVQLALHLARHIRKENELVLPLVHEHWTAPEQAAMVGRILSTFTPAQMARVVPWVVRWNDPPQRVTYLRVLSGALPGPAFAAVTAGIPALLPPEDWQALVLGVPALQGAAG